jgi:hypothetical protein
MIFVETQAQQDAPIQVYLQLLKANAKIMAWLDHNHLHTRFIAIYHSPTTLQPQYIYIYIYNFPFLYEYINIKKEVSLPHPVYIYIYIYIYIRGPPSSSLSYGHYGVEELEWDLGLNKEHFQIEPTSLKKKGRSVGIVRSRTQTMELKNLY